MLCRAHRGIRPLRLPILQKPAGTWKAMALSFGKNLFFQIARGFHLLIHLGTGWSCCSLRSKLKAAADARSGLLTAGKLLNAEPT